MDTTCFVVLLLCLGIVKTEYSKKEIEELAVGLEFAEFELEDHCITRNDVYWNFYRDDSYNFTSQVNFTYLFHNVLWVSSYRLKKLLSCT